jgi:hypothetical protein
MRLLSAERRKTTGRRWASHNRPGLPGALARGGVAGGVPAFSFAAQNSSIASAGIR